MNGATARDMSYDQLLKHYSGLLWNEASSKQEHAPTTCFDELLQEATVTLYKCHEYSKNKTVDNFDSFLISSVHNRFTGIKGKENCKKRWPVGGFTPFEDWHSPAYDPSVELRFQELVEEFHTLLSPEEQLILQYLVVPKPSDKFRHQSAVTIDELKECLGLDELTVRSGLTHIRKVGLKLLPSPSNRRFLPRELKQRSEESIPVHA